MSKRFQEENTKKSLISALAVVAMMAAPAMAQQNPIKIGVSGPFTGGSAAMGVSMRDGVKLATAEINKAGGVMGRQILLVERDDEAKNELGVQIAQELINKERVVATVGFINTGVSLASQRFYQEAVKKAGYSKPASIADSTNYGQLGRADLEKALGERGMKAVAIEKFNIGDTDMTAQALRARDAGADVVLTYAIGLHGRQRL